MLALLGTIYLLIDSLPLKNQIKHAVNREPVLIDQIESSPLIVPVSAEIGKTIFQNYCASCHSKNMKDDMTGPALNDFVRRWDNDTLRILKYIRNPIQYFKNNPSKRMVDLHRDFGRVNKPIMQDLTLEQVKSLIEYIELRYDKNF